MLTFKRRQVGDPIYYWMERCKSIDPSKEKYIECLIANCPEAVLPVSRDLSEVAAPAVDRPPSSSTTELCIRFLCGNQHLTTGMSCAQLACLEHPLSKGYGAYRYGYPEEEKGEMEMEREGMLQEMSSVCRRLLCFPSDTTPWRMSDLLAADGGSVSVARRKTSVTSAQNKISNCGDFCSTEYSGVWLRRWCIVRCYKRLKL